MDREEDDKFIAKFTEDLTSDKLDEAIVERVFDELSKIEHLEEVLLNEIRMDRVRFFNSRPEAQDRIKGACLRSYYWLKKLRSKKDKESAVKAFRDKGEFAI